MSPDTAWMKDAVCAQTDPDLWVGTQPLPGQLKALKRTCASCPVNRECLEYALTEKLDGIWGGTTPSERRQIARKRRA